MQKEDPRPQRIYRDARLEDIYFGTSDSESSEDSAFRCRVNTDRLKSKPVPVTRRQAKTSRPTSANTSTEQPCVSTDDSEGPTRSSTRKRTRTFRFRCSSEESLDDLQKSSSDSPGTSKRQRRAPPKCSRFEDSTTSGKPGTNLHSIGSSEQPQNPNPSTDPDDDPMIVAMKHAIFLYNFMNLPGGTTPGTVRPVYRTYLKRNLRFYGARCTKRKPLADVISKLHSEVFPDVNDDQEKDQTTGDNVYSEEHQPSPVENIEENEVRSVPFALTFYGIRNRMLAGDREATVELYLAQEVDGKYEPMTHLETNTFSMAVNRKDVTSKTIQLTNEISLTMPKDVSKINHYLVMKVTFSDESSISSGGRSLRKIPVRQSALHLRANDMRITNSPNKSRIESNELIMYGACMITSVTENEHTQPKISTRNGIVLLEANKIDADSKTWLEDDDIVNRIVKLAKKLHTNPFVLAEFVEIDDTMDMEDTENEGKDEHGVRGTVSVGNNADETSERIENLTDDAQFQLPEKIAYRFNAASNLQCASLQSAFKKQKYDNLVGDPFEFLRDFGYISISMSANMMLNQGRGIFSHSQELTEVVNPYETISPSKRNLPEPFRLKPKDSVAFGSKGIPFPLPDTLKVVTRVIRPSHFCIICKQRFPNMYALLMHMRVGYPRLDFVYRGRLDDSTACIDIFLNEHFSGDKETAGREYASDNPGKLPLTQPTYIVSKFDRIEAKSIERSLKLFETPSSAEKRLHERKQPISFNPISLHPYYEVPLNTTMKKLDQPWRIESMLRRLHDFTDLTDGEKEFMGLWNMFCLNIDVKPLGNHSFYGACRRFLVKCRSELLEKDLQIEWMAHVVYFKSRGFIDEDESYDLVSRYFTSGYDPEADSLHFISRDRDRRRQEAEERRKRIEEAEKKRLKDNNVSSGLRRIYTTRTTRVVPLSDSRESSLLNERSSVESSSLLGKKSNRHSKEADYSRYLHKY